MKTNPIKLSVILVSFNTAELTQKCLESVISDVTQSKTLAKSCEIFVVDNNSADDSIKVIKSLITKSTNLLPLKLIQNKENLGFAKANNQALKQARGEYILLLNSDTIVQNGALEALVNALQNTNPSDERNKIGLVAASLRNPDGSYQSQGGDKISLIAAKVQWLMLDDFPIIGKFLPSLQKKLKQPPLDRSIQPMGWVGATALCIPRKLYESIGGLDESIFMYAEDMEFCLRAQRAGWGSAIAHQAKIVHVGSASSNSEQAKLGEVRGILQFWPKYFGETSTLLLKLIFSFGSCLRFCLFTLLGRGAQANIYSKILRQLWV